MYSLVFSLTKSQESCSLHPHLYPGPDLDCCGPWAISLCGALVQMRAPGGGGGGGCAFQAIAPIQVLTRGGGGSSVSDNSLTSDIFR